MSHAASGLQFMSLLTVSTFHDFTCRYCILSCEPFFSCLKVVSTACSLFSMVPTATIRQRTPVARCNRASWLKLPVARSGTQDIAGNAPKVDEELFWWVTIKALFETPAGRKIVAVGLAASLWQQTWCSKVCCDQPATNAAAASSTRVVQCGAHSSSCWRAALVRMNQAE